MTVEVRPARPTDYDRSRRWRSPPTLTWGRGCPRGTAGCCPTWRRGLRTPWMIVAHQLSIRLSFRRALYRDWHVRPGVYLMRYVRDLR
ncbi:MAG: hypothetical protein ACRDZ4_02375 [Egibacteraceae bacterium]